MAVKITNNININAGIKRITQEASLRFEKAIQDATTEIKIRTSSGKTVEGSAFKPYSDSYAQYKTKKGRNASPPDLTFTGAMLSSIVSTFKKVSDTKYIGTIGFGGGETKKAEANQKIRPFFGLSNSQIETIKRKVKGE